MKVFSCSTLPVSSSWKSQKEVFARQVFAAHDLATNTSDNIQFLCRIHKVFS